MNAPVLVLGVLPRVAVAVARSLHRCGVPVTVAALSPSEPRVRSPAIRRFVRLPRPRWAPRAFAAALLDLVQAERYDLVIPGNDEGLAAIADHHAVLERLTRLGCPSPAVIRRVLDKSLTVDLARCQGIPVPTTKLVSDLQHLERLREQLRFPIVAKPRIKAKAPARKVMYFATFEALRRAFVAAPGFGETLLQEYCRGDGVGIETLMVKGHPLAIFQHRRLYEYPATGGVSTVAVSEVPHPTLAHFATLLLRALEWDGPAMVEFKHDRASDTAVLMEVNGRYWGSLALPIRAGIDFPLFQWQLIHGERPRVPATYPSGVRVRWLAGDVRRLHDALLASPSHLPVGNGFWAEFSRVVRDGCPPTGDALWSWRDPLPAVDELLQTIGQLLVADIGQLGRLVRSWLGVAPSQRESVVASKGAVRARGMARSTTRQAVPVGEEPVP